MLEIQRYLRSGGTIPDLLTRYAIKHRRHAEHENLVLFKYNQIASPFAEQIVCECRGIVLDEANDWAVISRAFSKFFNDGEGHAAPIDWSTARVQEKVDGSLCVLYFYAGKWHVATTGTPDGSGDLHLSGKTFAAHFWSTLAQYGTLAARPGHSFFFELTSPFNRIVVQHRESSLTLLGARHLGTDRELSLKDAVDALGLVVPVVREYQLTNLAEIVASLDAINPLEQEGYVVIDGAFNRIKIKAPQYVALHHAKDGLSTKAFVEIARSGETSEVLAAFPEFAPLLAEAKRRVDDLASAIEADFARLKHIEEQKAFAIEAVKTRCSAGLFQMRRHGVTAREFVKGLQMNSLLGQLGYKDDKRVVVEPEAA